MRKFTLFLFFVILIAGFLYATNPDKEDYKEWLEVVIEEELEKESDEGVISGMIGSAILKGAVLVVYKASERNNLHLCSVYTFESDGEEYRYLGIAKIFIPLQTEKPY